MDSRLAVCVFGCFWVYTLNALERLDHSVKLHPLIRKHIAETIFTGLAKKASIQSILLCVKSTFPLLKKLVLIKEKGNPSIFIEYETPILRIEPASLFLSAEKNYASCTCFRVDAYCDIPTIFTTAQLAVDEKQRSAFANWFLQVPRPFLHQYTITWHTPLQITLVPKVFPTCRITISAETPLTEDFDSRIKKAYTHCQTTEDKPHATTWYLDLRFRGQIILSKERGKG